MTDAYWTRSGLRDARYLVLAFLMMAACDSPPANGGTGGLGGAAGSGSAAGAGSGGTATVHPVTRVSTGKYAVQLSAGATGGGSSSGASGNTGSGTAGAAGFAGLGGSPIAQCIPVKPSGSPPSTAVCGDGFRTGSEACDDGNTNSGDGCSELCEVTPELVSPRAAPSEGGPPLPSRTIGAGRHPLVAGCNTVALAFADHTSEPPTLMVSTFSTAGVPQPQAAAQLAQPKTSAPNASVAALPGDEFAVAWTDFDDDELGISLRKFVPGAPSQSAAIVANEDSAFSQSEPDIVFDGNELVVAWVDMHDATTGPDLRYRLFAADLTPLTGDQTLAATGAVEDNVVLAGRNGQWAAAWRAGSQGMETIEVQSGASHWTVGPFLPGATDDRPDLIFLDETHLAVAFTMGTDPNNTGLANVPRLHAAVLDPKVPGTTESFALLPAQTPYATPSSIGQTDPTLVLLSDHLLVMWRSDAIPGDSLGSELWSRRVPFTVSGDTVTLDPSHIEAPLIQAGAQRDGDQGAFRTVATTLWPSGGIASVWDDSSRSFGAKAGGTDVVVQVAGEIKEPALPLKSFALSADGKYYNVNLLRRNYPPPTAAAIYAGGTSPSNLSYFGPSTIFDGDDTHFKVSVTTVGDPNAIVTLTVDMGQYFSVGAIRPWYHGNYTPQNQRIRLATVPGNWTTVLPTTNTLYDHTYSFDATPARYVEVTMTGASPIGQPPLGMALLELFVFPSAQGAPPPSTSSGYDLGYLSTMTVNSNAIRRNDNPAIWPAGDMLARTDASGDAIGIVDLGAQYGISRLSLGFAASQQWAKGGRLEVAAVPGAYSTVYDSGRGNQFGFLTSATEDFSFPEQLVRYVRTTEYVMPGAGPSYGTLWSVQTFANPAPRVAYYPLSDDGKYFKVNLARRATGEIQPTASVVYSNGAAPYAPNPTAQDPALALDGDDRAFHWSSTSGNFTGATTTVTVDLGQVQSLGAIRELYANSPPVSSSLRLAQTLAGPWTTVRNDLPVVVPSSSWPDYTTSFDAISARYVELTMKGTTVAALVNLLELIAYPSSTNDPAPSSGSHLDLTYLTGMSMSQNVNMGQNSAPTFRAGVTNASGYYVKTAAQGGTGDATATLDLGQVYSISEICFSFYSNRNWGAGGRVEVDDGAGNWFTVFDSGRGSAFGAVDGTQRVRFATRSARYVRVTGYFAPAASSGVLQNIEVF